MKQVHEPVLVSEVLQYLNVKKEGCYVDATVGGGGHSFEIIKRGGRVLGIEWDPQAIEYTTQKFKNQKLKIKIVHGNFKNITEIVREQHFVPVDGVLFDLGISSMQLGSARGFSFERDAPLDMRIAPRTQAVTAADLLNGLREDQLYELFSQTTETHVARAIARAIVGARGRKRIERTSELVNLVSEVFKGRRRKIHPATTILLALRLAVNSELENLKEGIAGAVEILERGGRLVVISFHSTEDRIVKQFLKERQREEVVSLLTTKPIRPTLGEVIRNPRARSARLRAAQKL